MTLELPRSARSVDKFSNDAMLLSDLLTRAKNGTLQLPDFQRGWVWDDNHITSLLASVSLSYPIGAVMTLRTGNPEVKFKPRPLEGVDATVGKPELLLLDGQQRATSLYLALLSGKPVPTRDSRKNEMLRRYFVDISKAVDAHADREDAIVSVPADGRIRNFRGEVERDLSTQEGQIEHQMFPLEIVLDPPATTIWQMAFLAPDPARRLQTWIDFNEAVVAPFLQYRVPTIELSRATPKEAVCQVFEKVNTGGVSLTVFELITATFAADNFNLREDWDVRAKQFHEFAVLKQFSTTEFLQVITLLASWERREAALGRGRSEERAPAVSCKRRDVLRLTLEDYQGYADQVMKTIPALVRFLHGERIFTADHLPYNTQLVPLAAIMTVLGDEADTHGVTQSLRRWFWCGVFGEMYGGSTETRFATDVVDVLAWLGVGDEPRTVRESQFQAGRLLTLRTRNSAAYKGLYAQQMKRGGRDFRTGSTIDSHTFVDDAVDVHHIFPRVWAAKNGVPDGHANSIVNKTTIDAKTNRRIGGAAPSKYLERIETGAKMESDDLDAILRSHDIDPQALRVDDFAAFFTARFERLIKQIEDATGKPVNRSVDGSDNPYAAAENAQGFLAESVRRVIAAGESKVVEFKSTGRKNLATGVKDVAMEDAVLKTVAGFMNTSGGTLLVGVADDGTMIGIEEDFAVQGKKNLDGWELWLTDLLHQSLGKAAAADVNVDYVAIGDRTVARIVVGPAAQPVFAKLKGKDAKQERFLVRINNATHELIGQQAYSYQSKRWPSS
jgi:cytochrome c551/c552